MSENKDKRIIRMDGQSIPKMQPRENVRIDVRRKIQEMEAQIKKEGWPNFLKRLKEDRGSGKKR